MIPSLPRKRDIDAAILFAYLADETSIKTTSTANTKLATSEKVACWGWK
jgi:hypothetical protein